MYLKRNSEFHQLFKTPRVDWCSLMSESKKANRLILPIVRHLKDKCPQLVQKCPYSGRYEVIDMRFNSRRLSVWPVGIYRIDGHLTDFDSNVTLSMAFQYEIS